METKGTVKDEIIKYLTDNHRYSRADQIAKAIGSKESTVYKNCLWLVEHKDLCKYKSNGLVYYGVI